MLAVIVYICHLKKCAAHTRSLQPDLKDKVRYTLSPHSPESASARAEPRPVCRETATGEAEGPQPGSGTSPRPWPDMRARSDNFLSVESHFTLTSRSSPLVSRALVSRAHRSKCTVTISKGRVRFPRRQYLVISY